MAFARVIGLIMLMSVSTKCVELPEEHMDVPQMINYWGYPAETHTACTSDGYLLTLHRIPHGHPRYERRYKRREGKRPVAFLQHGLLCSSSNWVINEPQESLGFILADAGYDVWLGNVRGNTYSTNHVTYSPSSSSYWDFSFDEMAKYDLPAMISYALNTANQSDLYYVGHSQGTMMAFAGLGENKTLQKQVKMVFALAPVARLSHTQSPIKYLSYFDSLFGRIFSLFGIREFLPSKSWITNVAEKVCPLDESLCGNVLFLLAGFDRQNLNETREPVYLAHTPAGTSVRNMLHFGQIIQEKQFQKYDYGYLKNIYMYGSYRPQVYDLKNVKNPIVLISGSNDWLADPNDVKWLANQLPHLVKNKQVEGYNHLDFIWGMKARGKIYKNIITLMKKYENVHNSNRRFKLNLTT